MTDTLAGMTVVVLFNEVRRHASAIEILLVEITVIVVGNFTAVERLATKLAKRN